MQYLTDLPLQGGAAERRPLPARAGLGLKFAHIRDIIDSQPDIGFFEVHAENFMVAGGPVHYFLERIRELYPLSIHGVGLSIGSEEGLDATHLERLAQLVNRYQPAMFSEHLAWSTHSGVFLNDLLPIDYNRRTLDRVCAHIDQVQTHLQRQMLLENPATYVEFSTSNIDEADFIARVVARTGCGLLLDVNNAYVSCTNHRRDIEHYLGLLPLAAVHEIHIAGFARDGDAAGDPLLIDSHGSPIDAAVWQLYADVIQRMGAVATLIERDNDVPSLATLQAEVNVAERILSDGVIERMSL